MKRSTPPLARAGWLALVVLATASPVHAQRMVSAYDPQLQVKPPTMKASDGRGALLLVDGDWKAKAAAFRKANPDRVYAEGGVTTIGEVVVVEGGDDVIEQVAGGATPRLPAIVKKVIGKYGDNFQTVTIWLTFEDALTATRAVAYEMTLKADVRGLGMQLRDVSQTYGSRGVLRSLLNMKQAWRLVTVESTEGWREVLETWGQESGHRWMLFLNFLDRRTGMVSDALLGRDCSHYHRLVHSESSVHDGLSWKDNGNGTFTPVAAPARYSPLDLYGMGVLPRDEVPPFFFIDNVPGYKRPPCATYETVPVPTRANLQGTRVDVTVEDVIAAEGPRQPSSDQLLDGQPQDYFREVQVLVTLPQETADNAMVRRIAERIERGRVLWEEWMRTATGNRMVVCTKVTADCGDPRSDVAEVRVNPTRQSPSVGPTPVELVLANTGTRAATGVEARLDVVLGAQTMTSMAAIGNLGPGERRTVPLTVDLRGLGCGAPIALKAASKSDFHRHRQVRTVLVGTEALHSEAFEADSGWTVNPDGNDTSKGAIWERATPQRTEIELGKPVQPDGAHGGAGAFVTGAAAEIVGKETYVRSGRSTLESPALDASLWREPRLRYWTAVSTMQATAGGAIVPSANARLVVQARRVGGGADAGASDWVEIDRVENVITREWVERIVPLPAAVAGGGAGAQVKLRFVAEDGNAVNGGVEVALDDIEIASVVPDCYAPPPPAPGADDGGGCSFGGRAALGPAALLALVALVQVVARSKRRRIT